MGNKILPIKPEDVIKHKEISIPDEVFEAVNELIVKHWKGKEATFKEKELVELLISKMGESDLQPIRDKIYDNNWLDFEDVYRNNNWIVVYDSPAYNENYDPFFTFKTKNTK